MKKYVLTVLFIVMLISAAAFSAQRPEGKGPKHLFILSGQSNMRQPLPESFTDAVCQVFGKDNVIVALHSHPSQPIKRWYKKWMSPEGVDGKMKEGEVCGTLYDALLKKVQKAIEGKELKSVTFVWMQGEADASAGWGKVYEKSFLGILDQFKKDLNLKKINFVLGRINDNYLSARGVKDGDLVRSVQVKLGEDNANGDWVNTDDLNTGVNPWGLYETAGGHFPNPAYRVMGQRFARKACRLIDPEMKLDEKIFDAEFFLSAEKIGSHSAIGKKISGTKPDAKYDGGGLGLECLLDGKFGSSNYKDKQWLGFSPENESVEFVVDLGKSQNVTEIAVNILISKEAKALFPKSAAILTSQDGSKFKPIVRKGAVKFFYKAARQNEWLKDHKSEPLLVLVGNKNPDVRFVKIKIETAKSWVFVDEIVVNPKIKTVNKKPVTN